MGLQIDAEIFRWLQSMQLAKEGKRTTTSAVELSDHATARLFDGVSVSHIVKGLLAERGSEEAVARLAAIKENSTPAIRLYNWNLLSDGLKLLGQPLDYGEKSKLLNLEADSMQRVLKFLFSLRREKEEQRLQVDTSAIGQKSLRQAANIFEFLVISISNNFKLSVQHTLNLFLDDNKYLAHLLVKGLKNEFDPIVSLLDDLAGHLAFIIDSLFCLDEQQSMNFLLNALKPCLISKSPLVAARCLSLLRELYEAYAAKGVEPTRACEWMEQDGINTLFFCLKRHEELLPQAISIGYAYLDQKLFAKLAPQEKSLIWNSEAQKLSFLRQLLASSHTVFLEQFLKSQAFEEWNRHCMKALKKTKNTQECLLLIAIYEILWCTRPTAFPDTPERPNAFVVFLKSCALQQSEILFTEAVRALSHLLFELGRAKDPSAPLVFKTLVSLLGFLDQKDRIEFLVLNFAEAFRTISALPAAPLAEPLLKHLQIAPSVAIMQLAGTVLSDPRLKEEQAEDILESLAKTAFEDVQLGPAAVDRMMDYLRGREGREELLESYVKAALAHFVSTSRELYRSLRELRQDHEKYRGEESMRRGEPSFLRNIQKYLVLASLLLLLQQALQASNQVKRDTQPLLFHTYIKIAKEMRKEHIARLLLPLLENYCDPDDLPAKVSEYENELQESILASPSPEEHSPQPSALFDTPKEKPSRLRTQEKEGRENSMEKSRVEGVRRELEEIKRRREMERERSLEISREESMAAQRLQLYRSVVNEKRIVEFGKKHQLDYDYKYLMEFDSFKPEGSLGLPVLRLLDLQQEEETAYSQDVEAYLLRYRKVWRFLFTKYGNGRGGEEEKIGAGDVWRMLRDYEVEGVRREESQAVVRKINEASRRKQDPHNLTYTGFEQYLLQLAVMLYGRQGYAHLPPSRQLALLLEHLRTVTAGSGSSTDIFDHPDEVYFQETEVIREFNRRLAENPDYVLPEGYKKTRQVEFAYHYTLHPFSGLPENYRDVFEALSQLLWGRLQVALVEPRCERVERCLARPALFQKMKEKLKDYAGGYLLPKRSVDLAKLSKQPSPVKPEYHLLPSFSLGIKLGLAGVDFRLRSIADEVAFWMDDALDAVQAGKLRVTNKAKIRVQNELLRRKRSEGLQLKLESIQQEKRDRMRAETVKIDAKKYVEDKGAAEQRRRQEERRQRQERKIREEQEVKRRLSEFEDAKAKLQAKRREAQALRQREVGGRRKEKEEYKRNVEEYFKRKKEELQEKEKTLKANREWEARQETEKVTKAAERKKRLEIEVFRKEEEVLQKIVESRQSYEEIWRSPDIQQDLQEYRPRLRLVFDLLLRYEKSKVSLTGPDEIGFNTLNFFALRTYVAPFLLPKNSLSLLFRSSVRGPAETKAGLSFIQFEELLFKVAVKAKDILNRRKNDPPPEEPDAELSSLKSSPELDRKKKSLTDEYALDALGVEPSTLKRLMDFIVLPYDKKEAEERFRGMLENTSSLPTPVVLREAQNFLDSIP